MNTKYRQSFFVLTVASFMLVVVVIPWSTKLPSPAAPTSVTDIYNVYYVAPSANCGIGNNPCYNSIQSAVNAADAPNDIVKVASGIYTDVHTRPPYLAPNTQFITQVVYISKTVTVQGGYTITNWTTAYPITQPTTLDAEGRGRVLVIIGNITATIEGLNITGGNAEKLGGGFLYYDVGSGIYVAQANILIRHNYIYNNGGAVSGVGIHLDSSIGTISENEIVSNTGIGGGGIWVYGRRFDSQLSILNNLIGYNHAVSGGGLGTFNAGGIIAGNTFVSNTAENRGGGLYLSSSTSLVSSNTLRANTANAGGGIYLDNNDHSTLQDNIVTANSAIDGGGIMMRYNAGTTINNRVTHNSADSGGGLYIAGGGYANGFRVMGNQILANTASIGGGVVIENAGSDNAFSNNAIVDNQASTTGGGIFIKASLQPALINNTIARNTGGDGSGVSVTGNGSPDPIAGSDIILTNTVLVSQAVGITVTSESRATLDGVLWYDILTSNTGGGGKITVTYAITGDPAFDFDGYHILSGSSAIDQGILGCTLLDIDNEPRNYSAPDLGADEYWSPGALKHVYLPLSMK